ncbi:MAG: hypothetical protein ACOC1F_13105 [Myxococcota bacterium]
MKRVGSMLLLLAFGMGACAAVVQCTPVPRTPQAQRFPHRTHLVKTKADCYTCHGQIKTSEAVTGFVSPGYEPCKKCHGDQAGPKAKYSFDPTVTYADQESPRHVYFSHSGHRDATEGQCTRCHQGVEKDSDTPRILPDMATCLGNCHQDDYAEANCTLCHSASDLTQLRPETDIAHGLDYVPRHQTDAARARNLCMACHNEQYCTSCHDTSTGLRAELRRLDDVHGTYQHEGDFVSRHAIEARAKPSSCVGCHEPSSCDTCHVENGVSGNAIGSATPHPRGWIAGAGNPNFHGRFARRRIIECASCHEQGPATNCIRCHRVGAFGGNPHPSGWRSGRSRNSTETCVYCHTN